MFQTQEKKDAALLAARAIDPLAVGRSSYFDVIEEKPVCFVGHLQEGVRPGYCIGAGSAVAIVGFEITDHWRLVYMSDSGLMTQDSRTCTNRNTHGTCADCENSRGHVSLVLAYLEQLEVMTPAQLREWKVENPRETLDCLVHSRTPARIGGPA